LPAAQIPAASRSRNDERGRLIVVGSRDLTGRRQMNAALMS
jgi:hypothetical protein